MKRDELAMSLARKFHFRFFLIYLHVQTFSRIVKARPTRQHNKKKLNLVSEYAIAMWQSTDDTGEHTEWYVLLNPIPEFAESIRFAVCMGCT